MKFSIVHEDDKHFKIHNPKDGTHFVVAKKGLSPEFIEKAQKLCGGGPVMMNKGGDVPDALSLDDPIEDDIAAVPTTVTPSADEAPAAAAPYPADAFNINTVIPSPVEGDGMAPLPQPQAQTISGGHDGTIQPSVHSAATSLPDLTTNYLTKAADAEKNALLGIAGAKKTEASANEKTLANQVELQQAAFKQMQDAHAQVDAENKPLRESIMNGKVDPNRYWNSKSTGSKISATIGLILGGIGSGLTRSPNAALEVMQKGIERDVQAQRDDLGKKQTLYSMNLDRYKNADAAYAATMLNSGNIAKTQIEMAAQRSGSQQAILQAQAAGAAIDMKLAPLQQQLAVQKMSMQNADPVGRQIRVLVPEKEHAAAFKELGAAKDVNTLRNDALGAFDQVAAMPGYGLLSPNDAYAAKNTYMGKMVKLLEGRYNHEAAENLASAMWPGKTDLKSTVTNKRSRLNSLLAVPATPLLSAYGIKPAYDGIYDERGNAKFKEGKPKL